LTPNPVEAATFARNTDEMAIKNIARAVSFSDSMDWN
jgi:hypothetical protein